MKKENIIDIITDEDGRKIVVITDIRFKGKRNIDWEDVENYLKEYVGSVMKLLKQRIESLLEMIFRQN